MNEPVREHAYRITETTTTHNAKNPRVSAGALSFRNLRVFRHMAETLRKGCLSDDAQPLHGTLAVHGNA